MDSERTAGASDLAAKKSPSAFDGRYWKALVLACVIMIVYLAVPAGMYPLVIPDETRHAGIGHDMWMGRQYLIPRLDGMPLLDGAPLHPWLSVFFLAVFGSSEWALRLVAAVCAGLTLMAMCRLFWPRLSLPWLATVCAVFMLQPSVMFVGRLAVPDMLNVLLLTVAAGSFFQAILHAENDEHCTGWSAFGWVATGFVGLGAGPLAMAVPIGIVVLWSVARRQIAPLRVMCWWPGPIMAAFVVVPWFSAISARSPGIVTAMLESSWQTLWGTNASTCLGPWRGLRGGLVLGSVAPLAVCVYRFRQPDRRAALRTPTASFMASWLALVALLHPLIATTAAGCAATLAVPLVYFSVLVLAPARGDTPARQTGAWLLHVVAALGVAWILFNSPMLRSSPIAPVARAVATHYLAATDKVVMLDRYDYAFNFYLRSPKLVFVAADWKHAFDRVAPRWMHDLAQAARHGPDTAERMLLTHEAFVQRLCGRHVVNLWIIGDESAPEQHPILRGLTEIVGTGKVRAWYLDVDERPAGCDAQLGPRSAIDDSTPWPPPRP